MSYTSFITFHLTSAISSRERITGSPGWCRRFAAALNDCVSWGFRPRLLHVAPTGATREGFLSRIRRIRTFCYAVRSLTTSATAVSRCRNHSRALPAGAGGWRQRLMSRSAGTR